MVDYYYAAGEEPKAYWVVLFFDGTYTELYNTRSGVTAWLNEHIPERRLKGYRLIRRD